MSRRFGLDLALTHLLCLVAVGLGWWQLAPSLTYDVFDGEPYLLGEAEFSSAFGAEAAFVMLSGVAGLWCAVVMLVRGHRGPVLPVGLALGGGLGATAAWWLGTSLGPGSVDDLAAAVGEGQVQSGPELSAFSALVVWPIVAVLVVLLVESFSEPEPRPLRSSPVSGR